MNLVKPWDNQVISALGRHCLKLLQFLAVIQQCFQVGEPESSVEAVSVRPDLANVPVLFVEVLDLLSIDVVFYELIKLNIQKTK